MKSDDFEGDVVNLEFWKALWSYRKPKESGRMFALRIGVDPASITNFKRGRIPRPNKIVSIGQRLEMSQEEIQNLILLSGGVDPELLNDIPKHGVHVDDKSDEFVYPTKEGVNHPDEYCAFAFKRLLLETMGVNADAVRTVVCNSEYMVPEIVQKDVVLIDSSQNDPESGKIYLVELEEGEMFCRVYKLPGKKYNLKFSNSEVYPTVAVPMEDVLVMGKVIWIGRFMS